jgi:hypothetical protein
MKSYYLMEIIFNNQPLRHVMKKTTKSIIKLAFAAIMLSGLLDQTARAQSSILAPAVAPVGGYGANPQEYLTVYWSFLPAAGGFTYSYSIYNPTGDVLMNPDGTLKQTSEIVDSFQVSFNAAAPGALVSGPNGGLFSENNGVNGLFWVIPSLPAGSLSAPLTFFSDLPPTMGNAQAEDSSLPSPWSSTAPLGQPVPVPNTLAPVPEPATMSLFTLSGLLLLPFRSTLRQIIQKK